MFEVAIALGVILLIVPAVTSIRNPTVYNRLFVPAAALIVLVWAGIAIWNSGVQAGSDAQIKFVGLLHASDAYDATEAHKVSDSIQLVLVAAVVYLIALRGLAALLLPKHSTPAANQ